MTQTKDMKRKQWVSEPLFNAKAGGLTGFGLSLFEMDSRIWVYGIFGGADKNEDMGYIPSKDRLLFPCGLPTATHEIAHMVEMKNLNRCLLPDWGMIPPSKSGDYSKWQSKAGFFAALSREIRVRAIERHMVGPRDTIVNILNNSTWKDMSGERLPFGRFDSMKTLSAWIDNLHQRTYNAWSLDRIRHEWTVRLDHIRHWMETKVAA